MIADYSAVTVTIRQRTQQIEDALRDQEWSLADELIAVQIGELQHTTAECGLTWP